MKFLSSALFPTSDMEEEQSEHLSSEDDGGDSDILEKVEENEDDGESEKIDDTDEHSNIFEILHSNFAPSRRLKPMFFEAETLVRL